MRFELSDRDRAVVQAVSQLGQLSTHHIKTLLFNDVSRLSMDRSIKRLRDDKLIKRVGMRSFGMKGGTPPAVYILGPKGWWYLKRQGDYPSVTAVREHTLHIADLFIELVDLDRTGDIKVLYDTSVEYVVENMRVDLYADIAIPAISKRRRYYIEVQEHARPDLIKQKLTAHWSAFTTHTGASYPEVAFVARDDYIKFRINRLIPSHMRELFTVYLADEFLTKATSTS